MSDFDRLLANEALLAAGKAQQLEEDALRQADSANMQADRAKSLNRTLQTRLEFEEILKKQAQERNAVLEDLLDQRDAALGKLMDAVNDAVFEKMSWMLTATKLGAEKGKTPYEMGQQTISDMDPIKKAVQKKAEEQAEKITREAGVTDEIKIGIQSARQGEKGGHLDIARESKREAGYVRALVNRATDQLQQKGSLTPEIAKDLENAKQAAEKIEEMNTPIVKVRPSMEK
jgi:hypothetical protein